MFTKFTDRARKVMALANQEAQLFNHEYIGTEHILLGLVKEDSGVAAKVLKNLDLDLAKARQEVEKLVKSGPAAVENRSLPQTPRAKLVLEYAIEESRKLKHNYIGTEHLLLGLLRDSDGVAAQVLINLGLNLENIRAELLSLLGCGAESKAIVPTREVDLERIAAAVREILSAVGEDPDREGLRETPMRVARMYAELFSGLRIDPAQHLNKAFTEQYDELVVLRDIPFNSLCEHHLMPFEGVAHVAYLPDGKIAGLSKLARVVDAFALRPQVQERLTNQIADILMAELTAKGVAVVMAATHSCMTCRGVKKPGSVMVTSALRGLCKSDARTRSEVMTLLGNK